VHFYNLEASRRGTTIIEGSITEPGYMHGGTL
ncbi:hypothetical protein MRB53_002004, partial [Persea americana]